MKDKYIISKDSIIIWAVAAINEITNVLKHPDQYEGKQFSSNEQLKQRISNYESLIFVLLGLNVETQELNILEKWINDSINGIERAINSDKELLNDRDTLKNRQLYFKNALQLLKIKNNN